MANAASGVAVADECVARFQELRTARAHRFVVFKIDDSLQRAVVDKVGARDAGFDDLTASLPADDCRYAVYDHDFTVGDATAQGAGGEAPRSKIFFVSWSPATADVKSKMVYASSNEGFKKELDGVQIDVQATEPSELTLDVLNAHVSASS
ncbi:unnamed protein product [Urochloa decumbens]|uniref:ADF-H domain-containing protein n=1 Tax=Urochloa decumbens TaxID=240449 RepID=A0ABC8Y5J8_9POAL